MIKALLIICLLFPSVDSYSIYKHKYFTNCDDGKLTGLSRQILLNGFYYGGSPGTNTGEKNEVLFLYENGVFRTAGRLFDKKDAVAAFKNEEPST
ncbi:MAG: hypothetical protein H7257_02705, partial [Taibaiella sp.]|nr:hypothetical protein [Taibaiella sp.]